MPDTDVGRAVQAIRERGAGRHLLLLCDFDGTLCEFDPDPTAVRLRPSRRALLESIAGQGATLALVSGRRLADVRERAGLSTEAYYAGLHGLEIEGGGASFLHPDVAAARDLLQAMRAALAGAFEHTRGVLIEDKGFSIGVHYRDASEADAARLQIAVDKIAGPHLEAGRIRDLRGACVVELLPSIAWNKGNAVQWILGRVRARAGDTLPVYLGDDITDQDAFHAVRGAGVAIAASTRPEGAEFVIDGPPAVERLLAGLATSAAP